MGGPVRDLFEWLKGLFVPRPQPIPIPIPVRTRPSRR